MYSKAVAEQLRAREWDVVAATEGDVSLSGTPDPDLFAWAQVQGRLEVTDNVGDYMPLQSSTPPPARRTPA